MEALEPSSSRSTRSAEQSDDDPSDHSGETLPLLSLSLPIHLLDGTPAVGSAATSKSASSGRSTPTKRRGYHRVWQAVAKMKRGHVSGGDRDWAGATVEDFIQVLHKVPAGTSAVAAVGDGLAYLDSRAAAALFKGLAKGGMAHHATELFDHLRALGVAHELARLCDVFTYTTMISQCSSQHQLQRALELVAEMRSRGVTLNVHAYSALLNVCLKSNELALAVGVRDQMLGEGLTPSIVTYNTLCEIYAKAALWADAVGVFDTLRGKGIPMELRTLNAIMTACNLAGRHEEALRVYEHILMQGMEPLAVTLAGAVTAYAGCRQLDPALKALQQMARRGLERPVSAFAALLSACEALGRWDVALEVVGGMERDGVRPSVACYAAAIGACLRGGQRAHAEQQFARMRASCGKVDAATTSIVMRVCFQMGQLGEALGLLDALMQAPQGLPDAGAVGAAIEALWDSGVLPLQRHALGLLRLCLSKRLMKVSVNEKTGSPGTLEVCLNQAGPHAACLLLLHLLRELRDQVMSHGSAALGSRVVVRISAATGAAGGISGGAAVHATLLTLLRALGAPIGLTPPGSPSGPVTSLLGPYGSVLAPQLSSIDPPSHHLISVRSSLHSGSLAELTGSAADSSSSQLSRLSLADAVSLFGATPAAAVSAVMSLSPPSPILMSPLNSGPLQTLSSASLPQLVPPRAELAPRSSDPSHALPGSPGGAAAAAVAAAPAGGGAAADDTIVFEAAPLAQWLLSDALALALVAVALDATGVPAAPHEGGAVLAQQDGLRATHAQLSLSGIQMVESGCFVDPQALPTPLLLQRAELVEALLMAGRQLGMPRAVSHDAAMFLDRACSTQLMPHALPPLLVAAASLTLAAEQASLDPSGVPVVLQLPADAVAACTVTMRRALGVGTLSVSALRVLNVLLERLGCASEEVAAAHSCGAALRVIERAVASPHLIGTSPSTLACAALYASRLAAGVFPAWPQALTDLTGVSSPESALEPVVSECLHLLAAL